jgi:NAD(P)-dependent dehydrogenase (short-subunit alcohol dehydrogenase family)
MTAPSPLIVVTGANRGIGFEIVRQLARAGATTVLTARQADAGSAAVAKLARDGLHVDFHTLDVTDARGLGALADWVDSRFGHLDALVNNAGILTDQDGSGLNVSAEAVQKTFETNTLGPLRVAQALIPLLRKSTSGRIINLSSGMGSLNDMEGGYAAYRISKAALNAVTRILAAELAGAKIAVNSMCPGWVKTDMGGRNAEREVAQGAETAVWLALEAPQTLTGKFVRDKKVIPW